MTIMKKLFLVIILCGAVSVRADSQKSIVLTSMNYMTTVRQALTNAQSSIDIQMYFIIANPMKADDPITTLVSDLVQARRRGVKVRVVLEDSKLEVNNHACKTLLRNGVDVRFDTGASLMHSKVVVVDSNICIVGSANWSRAAVEKNHEVGVLIYSGELAAELVRTFDMIKLRDYIPVLPLEMRGIPIPHNLLRAGGVLPLMITDRAEHSFNLYLYLLRVSHDTGTNVVAFDTSALEETIDCGNVRRPRLRLVEKYKAITYDQNSKQVSLLNARDKGGTFILPYKYWDDGLWKKLTLRGKYMYLVSLSESARSSRAPYWFRSQKDMAVLYGISEYTISLGLQELERHEIIEIERGVISSTGEHADRNASIYCLNPFMSDAERNSRLDALAVRHGEEVVKQAVKLSKQLDDPNDLDDIQTFIELIGKYGYDAVRKANNFTRKMKKGSSRRTIQTTLQILTSPGTLNGE